MIGRRIISTSLQEEVIDQLHINHMGTEKMRLLACITMIGRRVIILTSVKQKKHLTSYI